MFGVQRLISQDYGASMNNTKKTLSAIMLLAAAVIWGFAFAAQDALSETGAFTIGFVRSLFAGVFLIFTVMILDKLQSTDRKLISKKGIDINKTELIGGIICGSILTVATAFQQLGINAGTDGGKAGFITALYVVLVPIYSLALKKKAAPNVWISVCIAAIGFYLLCIKNDLTISPSDILVIICSLLFPLHILAIDRFSPKCDGVRMSMVQFFTATLINLVLSLIFESHISFAAIGSGILPLLYLGICSSGIAYTLQIIGQKNTDPTVASIILSLESLFGIIGTALFLGQALTVREYIGCAVLLSAVILSQIDFGKINLKYKKQNTQSKPTNNKGDSYDTQ